MAAVARLLPSTGPAGVLPDQRTSNIHCTLTPLRACLPACCLLRVCRPDHCCCCRWAWWCGQVSGEPIPVPKVDPADKERFDKTVDEIHAKVGPTFRF